MRFGLSIVVVIPRFLWAAMSGHAISIGPSCRMGNFEGVKNWFLTSYYSLVVRMGVS